MDLGEEKIQLLVMSSEKVKECSVINKLHRNRDFMSRVVF